jgi:ATP-binding cassette subfamily B multidrug efflux pump
MNPRPREVTLMSRQRNDNEKRQGESIRRPGGGRGHGHRAATAGAIKLSKDTIPTFKRLMSYYKGRHIFAMLFAMTCIMLSSFVNVKSSLFMGSIIDDHIAPLLMQAVPDYSGLLSAVLKMAGIYILGIIFVLAYELILSIVSNRILRQIREDVFSHLQSLPIQYYDTHSYGDIMSRFTNDIENIRMMLSQSIANLFSTVVSLFAIFVSMLRISLPLTGIVILIVAVMYILTISVGGSSAKYYKMRQKTLGEVNGFVEEILNGQKVVKVFCREEKSKEDFDIKNKELFEKTSRANTLATIMMPLMTNLTNIQYAVLAMVGGIIIFSSGGGSLTLGSLAAFLNLSNQFSRPIAMISQQINSVVMALAGAKRVFDMLDEEPEKDRGYVTLVNAGENADGSIIECEERTGVWAWKIPHRDGTFKYEKLQGEISIEMVDFAYVPGKQILFDVSLYAKPGQKIAFVGSTGAGKTTITNLLNRFYDIEDGKIRYDGININRIKKSELRKSLGMVLQDTNLFTGTIMENIRYGRLDATDEEVIAAAKLANADSFIEKLPEGYNTVISGTDSQLSQGQCQLLAIARCAVADPPVMILDEATSSVDTRTERLIQDGMDKLMAGRTVFVIAHRLSTVRNADCIMVLEDGRIIEKGSHEDLLAFGGKYYQLYTGRSA